MHYVKPCVDNVDIIFTEIAVLYEVCETVNGNSVKLSKYGYFTYDRSAYYYKLQHFWSLSLNNNKKVHK